MADERYDYRHARRPGDRLIRAGTLIALVGAAAAVATIVPFLFGGDPLPTAVYLLAMLGPVGLGVAIWGVLTKARVRSRRTRSAETTPEG
jgi:hypothetical protein